MRPKGKSCVIYVGNPKELPYGVPKTMGGIVAKIEGIPACDEPSRGALCLMREDEPATSHLINPESAREESRSTCVFWCRATC